MVYGIAEPGITLVVANVNAAVEPSFTDVAFAVKLYVAVGALDVSLTSTEAVAPCTETVRVSLPSVKLSAQRPTEIVARPSLPTTVDPVNCRPMMSED